MAEEKKSTLVRNIGIVLLILLLIGATGAAAYFYGKYQDAQKVLKSPSVAAQQEVQDLMTKVGKLIELPNNEVPTIATVSDASKLKDQPFFQNAKNGDKVLIFTVSKRAILYRPSENKIIDVGPVNLAATTPSGTPEPTKKVTPTAPQAEPTTAK